MSQPDKNNPHKILYFLKKHYPDAKIVLNYANNWELLVAVILSAQCTDKTVNKVTEKLFAKYKKIDDYADADIEKFQNDIRSTGFYKNKAKNIIATAQIIKGKFNKIVPKTMDELLSLPGVARKTANIVLGNAYKIYVGIAVDTHVIRLSKRLGFTKNNNPEKIETDLMKIFDQKDWFKLTYFLIEHGKQICYAKKPSCDKCFLSKHCPSSHEFRGG